MAHMHDRYERLFAPRVLLVINLAIIAAAETVGRKFFYDTGLIHLLAPMFVLLACVRIYDRFDLYDDALQTYVGWSMAAFVLMLAVHAMEFGQQALGFGAADVPTYGTALFLYLAALLSLAAGSFVVLRAAGRGSAAVWWLAGSAVVSGGAFAATLASRLGFAPELPAMLALALAFFAGLSVVAPTLLIRTANPALGEFAVRLAASLTFFALAGGIEALHFVSQGEALIDVQATYASAFAFYVAMSLFFLAFGKLTPREA